MLFTNDLAGFQVAIPVGLLVSAVFAAGSAFVDVRPGIAPVVIRRRTLLRVAVLVVTAAWFAWTVAKLPPLRNPNSEAARGSLLAVLAIVGTVIYAVSAARYWAVFRHRLVPSYTADADGVSADDITRALLDAVPYPGRVEARAKGPLRRLYDRLLAPRRRERATAS